MRYVAGSHGAVCVLPLVLALLIACQHPVGPHKGTMMFPLGTGNLAAVADDGRFTLGWNTASQAGLQYFAFLGDVDRTSTWSGGGGLNAQISYPIPLDDLGRSVTLDASSLTIADASGVWAGLPVGGSGVAIDPTGRLIVTGPTGLIAIEGDGPLAWTAELGMDLRGGAAVTDAGDVFVDGRDADGDHLLAVSAAGDALWDAPYQEILYPPVLGDGDDVLIDVFEGDAAAPAAADFALVAVDPVDGTELWRAPTDGWPTSPLVWSDGDVFLEVFGFDGLPNGQDRLAAYAPSGHERWSRDDEAPYGVFDGVVGHGVIDNGDRVWVPCQDRVCVIGKGGGLVDDWYLG